MRYMFVNSLTQINFTYVSHSHANLSIDAGTALDHFAGALEERHATPEEARHQHAESLIQRCRLDSRRWRFDGHRPLGLLLLLRGGYQVAQQQGHCTPHFVVAAIERAEAERGQTLQFGGVEERGLAQHLNQTLGRSHSHRHHAIR